MGLGADSSLGSQNMQNRWTWGVFWCGAFDPFLCVFFVGIPKGFRSHDSVFLLGQWNFVGACGCDFWWGWISHLFEIDTVHWCPKNIQVYLNHPNGWLFKSCEVPGEEIPSFIAGGEVFFCDPSKDDWRSCPGRWSGEISPLSFLEGECRVNDLQNGRLNLQTNQCEKNKL